MTVSIETVRDWLFRANVFVASYAVMSQIAIFSSVDPTYAHYQVHYIIYSVLGGFGLLSPNIELSFSRFLYHYYFSPINPWSGWTEVLLFLLSFAVGWAVSKYFKHQLESRLRGTSLTVKTVMAAILLIINLYFFSFLILMAPYVGVYVGR